MSDGAFPYALLVYVDSDGSGDWSPGDKIDAELCDVDDEPVSLVWFPPSEDLTETIFRGGRTGWVAERAIDGLSPGRCGGFAP